LLLANFLDARTIHFEPRILPREEVYLHIIKRLCQKHHYGDQSCIQPTLEAILKRERESSLTYPTGIAIPHIRMEGLADTLIGMTFLQNPLDYDGIEVSWVVLILTDKSSSKIYLNIVAALLKLSQDKELVAQLHALPDGQAVIHRLQQLGIVVGSDISIRDIMISDPVKITPNATLGELDSLINEHKLSMIPVANANNRYLGEVNILDVLKVGVPDYLMMMDNLAFLRSFEPLESLFEQEDKLKVEQIMKRDRKTLSPDASIVEAVYQMIQNRQRYYCVVEKGFLVGVVTAMDIFRKVIKA